LQARHLAWGAWVVPAICSQHGLADLSTTMLVDLFVAIERRGRQQVHCRRVNEIVPHRSGRAGSTRNGWYKLS